MAHELIRSGSDGNPDSASRADTIPTVPPGSFGRLAQQVPGFLYQFRYCRDGSNGFPFASDHIRHVYEVAPEEVRTDASAVLARIHREDYDAVIESIVASGRDLTVWEEEYRVVLPERGLRWLHGTARPELLGDGSVLWHGYIADITDRKKIELAERRHREMQNALISISSRLIHTPLKNISAIISDSLREIGMFVEADGVYIMDYDFAAGLCLVSDDWTRTGAAPFRNQDHAIPVELFPEWVEQHRQGETIVIEDSQSLPPGPLREILTQYEVRAIVAVPMKTDTECLGFIAFDSMRDDFVYGPEDRFLLTMVAQQLTNIRLRQRAEVTLRENEERLNRALEGADQGVWDWLVATGKMLHSRKGKAILGYGEDEIADTHEEWFSRVHPDHVDRISDQLRLLLDGEIARFSEEYRLQCKNGSYLWVLSRGKVVSRNAEGRAIRAIGTISDISERKERELQIDRLMLEKDILLKETHHRIKNNFATVEAMLSLQSSNREIPVEATTVIQAAQTRITSMRHLYEKLLATDQFQEMPLQEYLTDLIDQVRVSFDSTGRIELVQEIDQAVVDAKTALTVGSIVVELLTNSFKHAYPVDARGIMRVRLRRHQKTLELSVADDGRGLPTGLDPSQSKSFGLTIVQMMAEQLRGSIKHQSAPGEGMELTLSLPLPGRNGE